MALTGRLKFAATLGLSIAMMAPSLAISLNPQAMAAEVGAALPTAYILAAVVVPLLAWCFVVLARQGGQVGSLYGFVTVEFGHKSGTAVGWILGVTYTCVTLVGATGCALLLSNLWAQNSTTAVPLWMTLLIGVVVIAVAVQLVVRPPTLSTRIMLILEIVTVSLIVITTVIVLVRLLTSGGPEGQRPTSAVFDLTGLSVSALAIAVVYGITSFAGFEASATSGEESEDATRDVPRAILGSALGAGVFFVLVAIVMVWAYGPQPQEVAELSTSDSVVGDVADSYIGMWLGDLISIGAAASAFGTAVAAVFGGSRVWYAMARDGVLGAPLAVTNDQNVPGRAALMVAAIGGIALVVWSVALGSTQATFDAATTATGLLFLVCYLSAPVAAARALWKPTITGAAKALIVPTVVFVVVGYTLYRSAWPLPTGDLAAVPWIVGTVVIAGVVLGLAQRDRSVTPPEMTVSTTS